MKLIILHPAINHSFINDTIFLIHDEYYWLSLWWNIYIPMTIDSLYNNKRLWGCASSHSREHQYLRHINLNQLQIRYLLCLSDMLISVEHSQVGGIWVICWHVNLRSQAHPSWLDEWIWHFSWNSYDGDVWKTDTLEIRNMTHHMFENSYYLKKNNNIDLDMKVAQWPGPMFVTEKPKGCNIMALTLWTRYRQRWLTNLSQSFLKYFMFSAVISRYASCEIQNTPGASQYESVVILV